MLYTCKYAKFNDAMNEQELVDYTKQIIKDKISNQQIDDNLIDELDRITNVNSANEALEKYTNEHWHPVSTDQEIKNIIQEDLELDAYEAFENLLEINGLVGKLDENVISDAEMVKFANVYTEPVLSEYMASNNSSSSVVNFVDNYVRTNAIDMAEKVFSFDKYWNKLVENAVDNLVLVGVDQATARSYCTLQHRKEVQMASYSESEAEQVADEIRE
ncbi:hypothetical protein ACWCL1_08055 [Ligilactobacillus sp. LYQ135]